MSPGQGIKRGHLIWKSVVGHNCQEKKGSKNAIKNKVAFTGDKEMTMHISI